MSDLIRRQDAIDVVAKLYKYESDRMTALQELPTVEAKPVVHGSWETEFTALLVVYRCSECNCATALGQTNFCPNCGADMRGEKHD